MYQSNRDGSRLAICFSSKLSHVDRACAEAMELLVQHDAADRQFAVQLIMREVLNNGVLHGNRSDASKTITCLLELTANDILIDITDQGEGFDWRERIPSSWAHDCCPSRDACVATSSYGMTILATYTDEFRFNEKGNQVFLRLQIAQKQQEAS